jgi:hypothetical protein
VEQRAGEVVSIFQFAAESFGKLAEMTAMLKGNTEQKKKYNTKWSNEEIAMLKGCVERFGKDLTLIADKMKSRTAKQIKAQLEKPSKVRYFVLALEHVKATNTIMRATRE